MNDSELFVTSVQIEDSRVREALLDSVCKGDSKLRERIEKRIVQYEKWKKAWDHCSEKLAERFVESVSELDVDDVDSAERPSWSRPNPFPSSNNGEFTYRVGSRIADYEVLECLGQGGMGEVYLASDHRLQRKLALKILPQRFVHIPDWIRRFEREGKAACALNHPNIMTIYEFGKTEDGHFIASEFVDGQTLRSLIDAQLSIATKLSIAIQIAEALNAAHSAGIIHRDIKPENVMMRGDGLVKVLDFGIAKYYSPSQSSQNEIKNSSETEPGLMMGTIRYMSPEQARRMAIDFRTDLFSMGVVVFELLTNSLPFQSCDDTRILTTLMSDEPLQLNRLSNLVPTEFEWIIKKLLRKDREERYQSAKEVVIDLTQVRRQLEQASHSPPPSSLLPDAQRHEVGANMAVEASTDLKFKIPEVRYARSGDVNIAYQIIGKGEVDLVFVMGWISHLDWFWKNPSFTKFLMRLASFARLVIFDKRGTGLSDRVPQDSLPTLEQRIDDVRAVMDAAGSEQAILCGVSDGGPLCGLFATIYPQKTLALVMIGAYARSLFASDYPWGSSEDEHTQFLKEIVKKWGGPVGIDLHAPSLVNDPTFCDWWATYLRMGASPGAALALTKMNAQIDIRPALHAIHVPTIVLHRVGDRCHSVEEGRYLSQEIPGAKFVELPGSDHLPFVGNQDEILDPISEFLTGLQPNQHVHRILSTILCAKALPPSQPGILSESQRLGLSQAHFVREIELFRGRTIHSSPRQISASFDGPAKAIRAAIAVRDSAVRLGVDVHVGLHTGECEQHQQQISGPAVELAERVAGHGTKNEIVVSNTVKDLVAGSGIQFDQKDIVRLTDELPQCRLFQVKIYS